MFCGTNDMTKTCIHLSNHNHPIIDGQCRDFFDTLWGFIAQEMIKTSTAKTFASALATSKEFFDTILIHTSDKPKEMLWGKALDDVIDKFQVL